jgi:hypothetical protein
VNLLGFSGKPLLGMAFSRRSNLEVLLNEDRVFTADELVGRRDEAPMPSGKSDEK